MDKCNFSSGQYIGLFVMAILASIPIFGHLEDLPIRIWDESRLALNAYEMWQNGDFVVTHFAGKPDMWNTKPPMMIWCQTTMMRLFGMRELSVRLPSAIAAFFTLCTVLIISIKYAKQYWLGIIAVMVLITIPGYVTEHVTRTGDYDSLLILFTTASGLLFFFIVESQKFKFLFLFFILLGFAVLTKSIAGLMFLPALFFYALLKKQVIPLLKSRYFYIGAVTFLMMTFGYYLLREAHNPGYLEAVWNNELGGRFNESIEDHQFGFWFYFMKNFEGDLSFWYYFLPFGAVIGLISKDKKIINLTGFCLIMVVQFFIIISMAKTKLQWYDAPMYPYIAILVAISLNFVFFSLKKLKCKKQYIGTYMYPTLFLLIVFIYPYQNIVQGSLNPQEHHWIGGFYDISYLLKESAKGYHDLNDYWLLNDGYQPHQEYYLCYLGQNDIIIRFKDWKWLQSGDKVIVQDASIIKNIKSHYKLQLIKTYRSVFFYKITQKHETN